MTIFCVMISVNNKGWEEKTFMKVKTRNVTNNGKLPIGAYFGPFPKDPRWPDDPDVLNDESYKLARDGGFNFMIGFAERYPSNTPDVNRSLECAAHNGMRMILSDENIEQGSVERKYGEADISGAEQDDQTSIDEHGDHPGYWGCYIVDEPCPPKFGNMRKLRDMFYRVSPNNLFFINMLPSYAMHLVKNDGSDWIYDTEERLGVFRKYVAQYLDEVDPELFCYDYYPYMGPFPAFSGDFYANLAITRDECQKRGKPFWVSPQAGMWADPNTRGLSIGEMRHQNYTALAFGAKGFVYYVWSQAAGHTQGLAKDGKPTFLYYYAQECNLFIERYEKDFIANESLGVIVTGSSMGNIPDCALAQDKGDILSVEGEHLITGVFENEGKYSYLVTNNSITYYDNIVVKFGKAVKRVACHPDGREEEFTALEYRTKLDIGDCVYIKEL